MKNKTKKKKNILPKEDIFTIGSPLKTKNIFDNFKYKSLNNSSGKNISVITKSKQGKYIRSRQSNEKTTDIAIDSTIRNFLLKSPTKKLPIPLEFLQQKIRTGKCSVLSIFVLDASGSMGVENRASATKGAIFSILKDAYQKKDRVALISFRNNDAKIILPPTRSVLRAARHLNEIPTGGKTPLIAGIYKAIVMAKNTRIKNDSIIPVIILISDGKGNVPLWNKCDADLSYCASEIKRHIIPIIIIDTEAGTTRIERLKNFAKASKAKYFHIEKLQKDIIKNIAYG